MEKDEPDEAKEAWPDVPPVPSLPEAPELKPDLPKRPKSPSEGAASEYRNMGIAYSIPASLIAPIIVLTLGGMWLDGRLHKSSLFTMIGLLLGVVTGFINMIRLANRLNK